jgi:hypothetical protein
MLVKDLQSEKYQLIENSQDIADSLESLNFYGSSESYDFLIVETKDGEYITAYGGTGVPWLNKDVDTIFDRYENISCLNTSCETECVNNKCSEYLKNSTK